ncbi:hypothetical protein CC86DRAFT_368562 [Ophiobolus disseminans]|uniref:Glycosyltransferase 2 n=1 Tax=Ophiobolus disseminans TaxID=1469910 RepID=A0A6A7A8G0_9PLEO|nr:hypothetical protein CC86DRAFT_368562 [Ophiobolus disseminans]
MIRGHMLSKAMLPRDEELGKKDDDHRYLPARRSGWSIWNHTFRWRRRRLLLVVAGLFLGYMVWNSFIGQREVALDFMGNPIVPAVDPADAYNEPLEPTGPPPGIHVPRETRPHTFDGQIRFYRLARTLRKAVHRTDGYDRTNRNVLFAMSSLKSASNLIPMICEMSKWSRNHVHAAFFGREDIPLDTLLKINGVDGVKCPAMWHDARPDYMEYSSDARAQSAVIGALSHIHSFLHPQAAIVDDSMLENDYFARGVRNKTDKLGIPLIEIPESKWEDFMWITRLDAGSLRHWHSPAVDIMIQVPPDSSSVLRLMQSIKAADYKGLTPPRLIIELPAQLDESVKRHVEELKWPPRDGHSQAESGLVVRRRIANHRSTQEDAAIRFLELFYPTSTVNSHVLLLSPQAQLSPRYFHFVKYALLEYKFSAFGTHDEASRNLMGVSLELPSLLLDGKTTLTPPGVKDMLTDRYEKLYPKTPSSPFLWQAPNSHATLFFGDKWAELHSFLSSRVIKHQSSTKPVSRAKLVSESLPAWTEYMLEFMRARSYTLLYPAKSAEAMVTIHNELYHVPEEYAVRSPDETKPNTPPQADEPFLRGDTPPQQRPNNPEPPVIPGSKPLHLALPFEGDLPELQHLPHLLYDGSIITPGKASNIAQNYATTLQKEVGGCTIPKGKHRKVVHGEARDLFCFEDDDEGDWVDDINDELVKARAREQLLVDAESKGLPLTAFLPEVETATSTRARKVVVQTGVA